MVHKEIHRCGLPPTVFRFILGGEECGTALIDCCMSFDIAGNHDPGAWPLPDFLLCLERYTVYAGFADEIAD